MEARSAPPAGTDVRRQGFSLRRRLDRLSVRLESLVVLLLLVVALTILSRYFFSVSNFLNILLATSVIGVLAIGETFVISAAGIDLSIGSLLAFSGTVGAQTVIVLGLPWPAGILAALAGCGKTP